MRNIFTIVFYLLITASTLYGQLLSQGFENSTFPPAGWVKVNNNGQDWGRTTGTTYNGSAGAATVGASTDQEDSWLISSALNLTAGIAYEVSLYYRAGSFGSDDASLLVRMGQGQTVSTQQSGTTLGGQATSSTSWSQFSETFIPSATGSYYFSVQCNSSDLQSRSLYIDDIAIQQQGGGCTPLAGTYTIDAGQPTGGTNYSSFSDAVNDLINCDISAPVTFNVAANSGPYNEQVVIPSIGGSSSSNTITFNGNGETLQYNPPSSDKRIIGLEGADHITFNNLNVESLSSDRGFGFHLKDQSDHVTINNCTINLSAVTSTSINSAAGIVASGSNTIPSTNGNTAQNLTATNNTITGGASGGPFYAIYVNGEVGNPFSNFNINNNTLIDFLVYGIYLENVANGTISGNDISRPNRTATNTAGFRGIFMEAESGHTSDDVLIEKNRIHNPLDNGDTKTRPFYGIYFVSAPATAGNEIQVSNNLIYNVNNEQERFSMFNLSSNHVQYYHNTIALLNLSTNSSIYETRGFYLSNATQGIAFVNNLIAMTGNNSGSGEKFGFELVSSGTNFTSDNNLVFINTEQENYFGRYDGTNYSSLSAWNSATGKDANSVEVDPVFQNAGGLDFTPTAAGALAIGTNLLGDVPDDINGLSRTSTPDPGAFENTAGGCSLSVSVVLSTDVSCNGADDGAIIVAPSNGTQPYVYGWSGGIAVDSVNSNLALGTYSVTVTDDNGCTATVSDTINEPAALGLSLDSVTLESCAGNADGTLAVTATGGTPAYDFSWSNGDNDDNLNGLESGNYTVTVTDNNGCTTTGNYTISANAAIDTVVITELSQLPTVLSVPDTFDSYQWYLDGSPISGADSNEVEVLQSGDYYVEVTEGACTAVSAEDFYLSGVGIGNIGLDIGKALFPNPATHQVQLRLPENTAEDIILTVYSSSGKLMLQQPLVHTKRYAFNVSQWAKGIYLVQLSGAVNGNAKLAVH